MDNYILHTLIFSIQNNSLTCFSLPSFSYKFISFLPTLEPKKPMVEIEETNDVNSNIEMQLPSSQQSLQSSLQTPQEDLELRRSKC